jgi:magnesium-transporting ATPase (P-type)
VLRDAKPVELNEELRREIVEVSEQYAAQALRVMAGAFREIPQFQDRLDPTRQNGELAYARTEAFTAMAAFQWFQAFNARSNYQSLFSIGLFSNRWLLLGVGLAILLQILAVHSSIGQMLLGTTGLSAMDWLRIVLVSGSIWVADEFLKLLGAYGKPRASR